MRRAVDQREAQGRLQLLDAFADHRGSGAEFVGCFGEAAVLRDPHEGVELVQISERCGKEHGGDSG